MKLNTIAALAIVMGALATAGCANTIKGLGKDTANTVNAAQSAGKTVANAAN